MPKLDESDDADRHLPLMEYLMSTRIYMHEVHTMYMYRGNICITTCIATSIVIHTGYTHIYTGNNIAQRHNDLINNLWVCNEGSYANQ